jgi:HTH-type transcriptional regulator, sugar sensing transcriptional regulator
MGSNIEIAFLGYTTAVVDAYKCDTTVVVPSKEICMAGLDELVQRLQALGFSQYEARAYCALLQKSPANGHEVAKTAGIPTSKIYETLERLHQKGAVLVQRSEPTVWAPVPHRELVAALRNRMETTFSAVEQGLAQLGREQDTRLTWSLSGRGNVMESLRGAIDRTQQRLVAVIPARDADQLAAALKAAVERGVALDLIVSDGAVLDLPNSDRVRVARPSGSMPEDERLAVVVGDGEETVLADLGQDRPQGMWTHHPAVALLAEAHVRTHD